MPRTLHRTPYEHSIAQWTALVCATVAECHNPFRTFPDRDTLTLDYRQHHLSLRQFAYIADWTTPIIERPLFPGSRIRIAMVHSDLVAINERSAKPARIAHQ